MKTVVVMVFLYRVIHVCELQFLLFFTQDIELYKLAFVFYSILLSFFAFAHIINGQAGSSANLHTC